MKLTVFYLIGWIVIGLLNIARKEGVTKFDYVCVWAMLMIVLLGDLLEKIF